MSIETNPEAYVGKPLPCRRCGRPLDHEETSAFCLECGSRVDDREDDGPRCHKCEATLDVGPAGFAICLCDSTNSVPAPCETLTFTVFDAAGNQIPIEPAIHDPNKDVFLVDRRYAARMVPIERLSKPDLLAITREVARK